MPPGPAFNVFCVLSSIADILTYVARIRAAQSLPRASGISSVEHRKRRTEVKKREATASDDPKVVEETEILRDTVTQNVNFRAEILAGTSEFKEAHGRVPETHVELLDQATPTLGHMINLKLCQPKQ